MSEKSVYPDNAALEGINSKCKKRYLKAWASFKEYISSSEETVDFETKMPVEDYVVSFFRYLRIECNAAVQGIPR